MATHIPDWEASIWASMAAWAAQWRGVLAGVGLNYWMAGIFFNRIYPPPALHYWAMDLRHRDGPSIFSTPAHEAAVRLQRVGGDGSLGRMALPILTDDLYTDLPSRRHIDAARVQAELDAQTSGWWFEQNYGNGYWIRRCIYHRKATSYSTVTSFRVLPNPTRYWQRWRKYYPPHDDHDSTWAAPQQEQNHWTAPR